MEKEQNKTKKTCKKCAKEIKMLAGSGFLIISFLLGFIIGCKNQSNHQRGFFPKMKSKYTDMAIAKDVYFLKSFGLSSESYLLGKSEYWKLTCGDSYFFLSGYLRKKNDSIMFVPIDFDSASNVLPEYKLFDFGAPINSNWKIYYNRNVNPTSGDSITYTGKKLEGKDTLYQFSIYHFYFDKLAKRSIQFERDFTLEVSEKNGITSITRYGVPIGVEFKAILYPKEKFINRLGNASEL